MPTAGSYARPAAPAAATALKSAAGVLVEGDGSKGTPFLLTGSRWVAGANGAAGNGSAQSAWQPASGPASVTIVAGRRYLAIAFVPHFIGSAGALWAGIFTATGAAVTGVAAPTVGRRQVTDVMSGAGAKTFTIIAPVLLGGTDIPVGLTTFRAFCGGSVASANYAPNQTGGSFPGRIDVFEFLP